MLDAGIDAKAETFDSLLLTVNIRYYREYPGLSCFGSGSHSSPTWRTHSISFNDPSVAVPSCLRTQPGK